MQKDLIRNPLTLFKFCVYSFSCGARVDLWPFYAFYYLEPVRPLPNLLETPASRFLPLPLCVPLVPAPYSPGRVVF